MEVGNLNTLFAAVRAGIGDVYLEKALNQLDDFANKVKTVTLDAYNGFLQLAAGEAALASQAGSLGLKP